jgi:type II secretion system protein J
MKRVAANPSDLRTTTLVRRATGAFTIIEIMIAMFIFALVLTAIYSIWHGILKGTASGLKAAAEVQRSRVAMRSIEQALLSARVFTENIKHYYFITDSSGEKASIEMTCRLPVDFLGMGYMDPNLRMRRVKIGTRPSPDGGDELVLSHYPMLIDPEAPGGKPYSIVLARDVSRFELEFLEPRRGEWVSDWISTNTMPRAVRVTLGLGKLTGNSFGPPQDLVSRIVAMPAQNVAGLQAQPPGPPIRPPPPP